MGARDGARFVRRGAPTAASRHQQVRVIGAVNWWVSVGVGTHAELVNRWIWQVLVVTV